MHSTQRHTQYTKGCELKEIIKTSDTSRILLGEIIFTGLLESQDESSDTEQHVLICFRDLVSYTRITQQEVSLQRVYKIATSFTASTLKELLCHPQQMLMSFTKSEYNRLKGLQSAACLPCTQTHKHLELPVFADVSGCVVDGSHEATEVAHSGLPVFIWSHLPLLCTFKVHLCLFCWSKK